MFIIERLPGSELFAVINDLTRQIIGQALDPRAAVVEAIANGMPAQFQDALIARAQQIIREENAAVITPAQTAGDTVNDDRFPNPLKPPPLEVGPDGRVRVPPRAQPSNAEEPPLGPPEEGVDQPVRPLSTTQATGPVVIPGQQQPLGAGAPGIATTTSPGVARANDDNPPATSQTVTTEINNGFNRDQKIEPQPNALNSFANVTYSASVYLLSPSQYRDFVNSKRKQVNGYNLLFQSGGAPLNRGGIQGALNTGVDATGGPETATSGGGSVPGPFDPDAGRNPFFTEDFYIDSITLENLLPGKGSKAAHLNTSLKFTVIEPNGITLLDRLYQAVQDNAPTDFTGAVNYTAAQYLMVIRWYGYDLNGNIVKAGAGAGGVSDPNAVIEKFIPFSIRSINWSVASRLVTYDFDCAPIGQRQAGYTDRGTVPYDVELRESTVGGLLGGTAVFNSTAPSAAAPGAATTATTGSFARLDRTTASATVTGSQPAPTSAANAPTPRNVLTGGLVDAMNKYQQELVNTKKVYTKADTYEVVFASGAEIIRDAKITLPGAVRNQSSTPMGAAPSKDATSKDPSRQKVIDTAKKINITAGQQLLYVIDQAIRNSSFIYNQAALQIAENPPDPKALADDVQQNASKDNKVPVETTVLWYLITMEATPKEMDEKRNDYAYHIRYIISVYPVQNFNSKYYSIPKFRGIHKLYRYWFTGENIDVLDYTATFNSLYHMTVSGREPNDNAINKIRQRYISSMRELPRYVYSAASDQARQGAEGQANEIAANAAESLYSPSDLANCKLRIIGDPAWIQQGSVAFGVDPLNFNYSPFLPDGTINIDAEQAMFAIEWQRPKDYDLNSGLADPYRPGDRDRKPNQSVVYMATKVTSEFRQGRFEQTLEGSLYIYPVPNLNNTATQPSTPVANSGVEQRANDPAATTAVLGASTGTRANPPLVDNTQTAVNPDYATNTDQPAITTASVTVSTDAFNNVIDEPVSVPVINVLPAAGSQGSNPTLTTVPTNQNIAVER